ncbi:unnamed protein product, partial [Closterium sp. NIES-53]
TGSLIERREPASHPASLVCTGCRVPRPRPPPVLGTHAMGIRPSSVPLRVPLPPPPKSSLPVAPDPKSDLARAAKPTVSHLLATVVTDPSFESTAASALVAELVDFAVACRLEYTTSLVAESSEFESAGPPSVGGQCSLGTDVLEDTQKDFECLAAAVPCFPSMLLAPEGDPDAPDIPTPRSYTEAITRPYSSQWQAAMDADMASWKSTSTYVDAVPPSRANIVDGMWIFRRDYVLHSLDFSTAFLQGSLHEEIWLRRTPGFIGSFRAGTEWSLRRPVYGLCQAPREWHDTLWTTLAALGLAPSTADPSLARRTIILTQSHMVHQVLQRFGFQFSSPQPTPLSTSHSLSAPPSDKTVEPSDPYPELVGCLITSGMELVLGGRGPVVLTGHADNSWLALLFLTSFVTTCSPPLCLLVRCLGVLSLRVRIVGVLSLGVLLLEVVDDYTRNIVVFPLRNKGEVPDVLIPWIRTVHKLSSRAIPYVFLGFPPDAHGWQFYHPTSRRVLPSQDVTFDEPVPSPPPPLLGRSSSLQVPIW